MACVGDDVSGQPVVPMFRLPEGEVVDECKRAIGRVVDSNWYILGEEVRAFEAEFAAYCGVAHCVGVGNGTDALEIALRALGVGAGDRVAVVANAGHYGSIAVRSVGAAPLYVDVLPNSLNMDPGALERALAGGPKAVIVTHLYGRLADLDPIRALTDAAGIGLIEDCAQAHGATRSGRRAGAAADIGCFSFYPTKNLGAIGDGGALVAQDAALAGRIRQLRQYGWREKYRVELPAGRNSRLDELQAAALRVRLRYLDAWNAARRAAANRYTEAFADLPLTLPETMDEAQVGHLYVVRTARRDALRAHLTAQSVASDIHFPVPDHRQPTEVAANDASEALPVTEQACGSVLSLPCFPGIRDAEVERVIGAVRAFFATDGGQ